MSDPASVFDKALLNQRLSQARNRPVDFVTELVVADLGARLETITRTFSKALILAPDARHMPLRLKTHDAVVEFERMSTLAEFNGDYIDPENFLPPSDQYDLIVSIMDIGVINDVPGFLYNVRRHLVADGLFVAAFVGGGSLGELRQAWLTADAGHLGGALSRVAPFVDATDAGGLLQRAGFALPVADIEFHNIRYASPLALMEEIKTFCAANPLKERGRHLITPAHLNSAIKAYQEIAGDSDGRVRASLEIIWMSGWAPHESQQKPLAPGSAQVSLADVLGKKKCQTR
ncbi:SAM-dependent methyltransferase, BioC-like [hydrothermal vent metagenome]|uniref:SAM-dependent methyltransferase, BioC-like n=1 Tax=hydrothermal vent metagenome TaxID=652676 RepID=A0A3B0U6S6_9ZZZZ